jgi:hypothetical protein
MVDAAIRGCGSVPRVCYTDARTSSIKISIFPRSHIPTSHSCDEMTFPLGTRLFSAYDPNTKDQDLGIVLHVVSGTEVVVDALKERRCTVSTDITDITTVSLVKEKKIHW